MSERWLTAANGSGSVAPHPVVDDCAFTADEETTWSNNCAILALCYLLIRLLIMGFSL